MSGARNIILRTACGCEQMRAWPEPLPSEIRMALHRPLTALDFGAKTSDPSTLATIAARRFVRRMDENGVPVYREHGEVMTMRPAAPRLSNDEWASAVARFARENTLAEHGPEDRERAASWATADMDFLARHDGGVIVCHEQTHTLIGAFYPAPSWDASEDCVRFWSTLRRLMATEAQEGT